MRKQPCSGGFLFLNMGVRKSQHNMHKEEQKDQINAMDS